VAEEEEEEEVPEEELPVLDPVVEEALQPAESIMPEPEPEEEEEEVIEEDKPDPEKAPIALLDLAEVTKAKGPVDYLNFIQDNGFIPETWDKFVNTQDRSDLEYQEGDKINVVDTGADTGEAAALEAVNQARSSGAFKGVDTGEAAALEAMNQARSSGAFTGGKKHKSYYWFFSIPEPKRAGTGIGNHVEPVQVMKNLWLGNKQDSQNVDFLKKHKIHTIFNCTPEEAKAPIGKTVRFSIKDSKDDEHIMEGNGITWAQEIMKAMEKGPVLVHCIEGRQRSATLVALIMGLKRPRKLKTIIKDLQSKRPIALTPEPTFCKALEKWFG
jgi:hypothetical protein